MGKKKKPDTTVGITGTSRLPRLETFRGERGNLDNKNLTGSKRKKVVTSRPKARGKGRRRTHEGKH